MHCINKFKNNNCTALIQHTLNRYKIISECIVTTTSTTLLATVFTSTANSVIMRQIYQLG